jgi:nucleoside-diphosphate-sugar epimerase
MHELTGKRILITGVTGQVAGPVAAELALTNTVFGAARFKDPAARAGLEAAGVTPVAIDLERADLDEVPSDLDHVLHFAVAKTNDFDRDLAANAEGVAFLIEKAAGVQSFLHCSSTAVYEPHGHDPRVETDELGDNHRPFGFMPTYSISKIAAETCARYAARRFSVPVTIARLNVPYGDTYGWPLFQLWMMKAGHKIGVHANAPSQYNPIHHVDIVRSLPYLLGAASVPATVINWGGPEIVSIEQWCAEMGRLTGLTPSFETVTNTIETVVGDVGKLRDLGFTWSMPWHEGIARLVSTTHPELVKH